MERFLWEAKEIIFNKSIETIEACVAKIFLMQNGITDFKNRMLFEMLKKCQGNEDLTQLLKTASSYLNIKNIERLFELLIQNIERKKNGVYYTPEFIVNYIINKTIKCKENVCDPSCGSGAFLIEAANKISKLTNTGLIKVIENNIYGVDLSEHSVRQTKLLLTLLALQRGEDKKEIKFNIIQNDSLLSDWHKLFPEIIKRGGFDVVIGNPPYIKLQTIKLDSRKKILDRWHTIKKGNFNTYIAFVELALSIINDNGIIGYIIPNNYFTSLVGKDLRALTQDHHFLKEIVDFNRFLVFKDARSYTCITILDKKPKKRFTYHKVLRQPCEEYLKNIKFDKIKFGFLDSLKWRLLPEIEFQNILKIETKGNPLGKIAKIKVGIATLKDALYFVDGKLKYKDCLIKEWKNKNYLIEEEITRSIVKIGMIGGEEQIRDNTLRIIFPYKKANGIYTLINEEQLNQQFPGCYKYLITIKNELSKRDKGKKIYPIWYAYGRGQGLNNHGPKLLTPTFSNKPNFMLDKNKDSLYCNGYAIYYKGNLRTLQKVLNSIVMDYYIKKTSISIESGYWCYQKNFIERFSIPEFTTQENYFLENTRSKEKIDDFLIKKYGISIIN